MLIEIKCDKFRVETISFHEGLNVVLGDENATNSIGKSTLLMVIDFVFGGRTLLDHNTDLVAELGDHDYLFAFTFGETTYRFRRSTQQPDIVYTCDDDYSIASPLELDEYTAFLKGAYGLANFEITFRALAGLYFRVWGKDNLNVHKPLHIVQSQRGRECVDNLLKTYGKYSSIAKLTDDLKSLEAKQNALKSAFRHRVVPKIGKKAHQSNVDKIERLEREINEIKENLARYATNIAEVVNREVLDLKIQKDRLLATKLTVQTKLVRAQRNLSTNKYIKSKNFESLVKFFPDINQDRLVDIEGFHSKLVAVFRTELSEAASQLGEQLARIDEEIARIDGQMATTLNRIDEPSIVVDRVYELATTLQTAHSENTYYESEVSNKEAISALKESLAHEKSKVLSFVQNVVNDGLRRIVTSVFGHERKSPQIRLGENNYSYDVFEDTGTGTAYSALVVLDLTVFESTELPFLAHDSLLFKNIENDSVARLFGVYARLSKQSFVAIDDIEKYGAATVSLLRSQSVVRLSDSAVLYIKDWRR